MSSSRDPVELAADGTQDLQGVVTWEPRSLVDRLSAGIYGSIRPILRWLLVLFGVFILLVLVVLGSLSLLLTDPSTGVFVALSAVPAFLLAAYIWWADVTTSEPLGLLVGTFAFAVLFAGFAALINSAGDWAITSVLGSTETLIGGAVFFYLIVAPVEETVKLLAVRLLPYRSGHFDAVIDGAVYGAVAGLGFATIENAIYITGVLSETPASQALLPAAGGITVVRALAGPGHVIYSGIAGYYLGLAKFNREYAGPLVVKGLLLAGIVHATYNTSVGFVPGLLAAQFDLSQGLAFLGFILVYDGVAGLYLLWMLRGYRKAHRAVFGDSDPEPDPELAEFDSSSRPSGTGNSGPAVDAAGEEYAGAPVTDEDAVDER